MYCLEQFNCLTSRHFSVIDCGSDSIAFRGLIRELLHGTWLNTKLSTYITSLRWSLPLTTIRTPYRVRPSLTSEQSPGRPAQSEQGIIIFLCMEQHGYPPTIPISNYPDARQGIRSVSALEIIYILRAKTHPVGKARLGFTSEEVRTHSLCCGRSMVIYISGVQEVTLMAIGQWCWL